MNTPYSQKYDYNYNHNYYRKENIYNCPCHNYDYERRKRRIKKLEQHSSTSQMDDGFIQKNVVYYRILRISTIYNRNAYFDR